MLGQAAGPTRDHQVRDRTVDQGRVRRLVAAVDAEHHRAPDVAQDAGVPGLAQLTVSRVEPGADLACDVVQLGAGRVGPLRVDPEAVPGKAREDM